jgi:hypothetical protein
LPLNQGNQVVSLTNGDLKILARLHLPKLSYATPWPLAILELPRRNNGADVVVGPLGGQGDWVTVGRADVSV